MISNEQTYLDVPQHVMNNGVDRADRTGVGVRSVFGMQTRYDLRAGFPLLTTKKVNFAAIASELLWFIEGSGDERRLAEIRFGKPRAELADKKTIWTANAQTPYWKSKAKFEGDLGKVYGQMWRKWPVAENTATLIKRKPPFTEAEFVPTQRKINQSIISSDIDGTSYTNTAGQTAVVVGKIDETAPNSTLVMEFDDGTQVVVKRPNARRGEFKHPYQISVRGVGCLGRITVEMKKRRYYKRAYDMWNAMLARCYDASHPSYTAYGAKGVIVSARWKCFENFLNDISEVPYFHAWVNNREYEIDKDYYGSNGYSKETTIFLTRSENASIGSPVQTSDGRLFQSISEASGALRVASSTLQNALQSGTFSIQESPESDPTILSNYAPGSASLVRKRKVVDQLANLIKGIKKDPFGRRHILSAWNPGELDEMALPPCHVMCQFYVAGDELSCMLFQRSNDLFLGSPFNIASYALLTKMIAQVCGLRAGDFVYSQGDTHIYQNHFEQVKEQLSRKPKASPHLYIDPTITDIDDFDMSHFEIIGYDHHGVLRAPMAV